jgi:hypothetical protein
MLLHFDRGPLILQVGLNTAWVPLEKWVIPMNWTCCDRETVFLLKHPRQLQTGSIGTERLPEDYCDNSEMEGRVTLLVLNRPAMQRSFQLNLGIDDKHLKTMDFASCLELRFVAVPEGFVIYYRPSQEVVHALPKNSIDGILATLERAKVALQSVQDIVRADVETFVRPTQ